MRLICPNCGAQYEVADDVIPAGGRDVQCSNCGHTWFEQPGASEAAEMAAVADTPPDTTPEPVEGPAPEPDTEPEEEPEPEPVPAAPAPREMDPEVADILREEAEYEQSARQADNNSLETQPDLDLSQDPEEDRRGREARDRLARLRGEPEVAAAVGAAMAQDANAPRRELLPDIEEINSSLRPDSNAAMVDDETADAPRKRSGFRRGFMFIVILALIALAVYIFAPQISAAVPQIEPYIVSYVEWVNGVRIWLDGQVQGLIEGASSDAPPEG